MSVDLEHYLVVGAILFAVGMYMVLAKRNFVGVLNAVAEHKRQTEVGSAD